MLVSIIIPVRNSEAYIRSCLGQLASQDYPHDLLEVIVADGASTDGTVAIAESFDLGDIVLRVLPLTATGRSQGLNAAIRAARGSAICRLDARTRIESNYVTLCVEALTQSRAANVGGTQVPDGTTDVQTAIGFAMAHPFGVGNAQFRIAKVSGFVDTVYLGFFRKDIFDKVGYFDETANVLSEDSDMNERIRAAGEKVFLDVRIRAGYVPRATLKEQFELYFRYGGARAGNLLKHRRLTSSRQLAAPTFIALNVILPFLACITGYRWIVLIWLAVDIVYALADAIVSMSICSRKHAWRCLPALLLAFPCMHIGWGLGFWRKLSWPDTKGSAWKG